MPSAKRIWWKHSVQSHTRIAYSTNPTFNIIEEYCYWMEDKISLIKRYDKSIRSRENCVFILAELVNKVYIIPLLFRLLCCWWVLFDIGYYIFHLLSPCVCVRCVVWHSTTIEMAFVGEVVKMCQKLKRWWYSFSIHAL